MSCFVLSSWSHIDFCGVVKLCTVVFVRVLVEHFERRLLYALFCVCCWCNRCFLRCCPLVYGLLCVLLLENCYLKCFLVILIWPCSSQWPTRACVCCAQPSCEKSVATSSILVIARVLGGRFFWPGFNDRVFELLFVSNAHSFCVWLGEESWELLEREGDGLLELLCLAEVWDVGSSRLRRYFLDSFWARARARTQSNQVSLGPGFRSPLLRSHSFCILCYVFLWKRHR